MFIPEAMSQINIFVLEEDVLNLTMALGKLGVIHLNDLETNQAWEQSTTSPWSERASQYEDLQHQLKSLFDILDLDPKTFSPAEIKDDKSELSSIEAKMKQYSQEINEWENRSNAVKDKIDHLHLLKQEVEAIAPLNVKVDDIRSMNNVSIIVGSIPSDNLSRLRMALFRIPFVIIPIHEYDHKILIFAASAVEDEPILNRALESALIERLELPAELSGSPKEMMRTLDKELKQSKKDQQKLNAEKIDYAKKHQSDLAELWQRVSFEAAVMQAISKFSIHEDTYLISGWAPTKDVDEVVKTVKKVAKEKTDVEVINASVKEPQTPTLLNNPRFLKPFQGLITIYGLPAYGKVDPTLFVGLTYILMFGMMFGDLGHGFILFLLGLFLAIRKGSTRQFAPVVIAASISSMMFGLLFGSFFGKEGIIPHLWTSPLTNVMTILIVAVAGGAVILNIGFILHMVSAGRSKDWAGLLFNENGLAGISLYWVLIGGGVLLILGKKIPISIWLIAIAIPALIILMQDPLGRLIEDQRPLFDGGIVNYLARSFFGLFEALLGYFTNSISFVRLGAFAVAHAALGQVIFIMANLSKGFGHWLILVIGTVIIVGFEGMVVAIQALRLEYYEFFDKFYTGSGHAYEPFRLPQEG
jgi:V/A-type H+/Na+-transporting ATPase subunit I